MDAVRTPTSPRRLARVGLVALVVAVVSGLVSSCSSGPLGEDTMEVTVYLSDSAGLFEGNDVGVLGVPVGEVTDIEPQGSQVKVTIEVEDWHPHARGPHWRARIGAVDLREFCLRYIALIEDTVG